MKSPSFPDAAGCLELSGVWCGALKDVSLEVHAGELMAVLGSKGSGKRAVLDAASGRIVPSSGTALLGGRPPHQVSFVPRSAALLSGLTVRQTLHYAARIATRRPPAQLVKQTLSELALTQTAGRLVESLEISEYRRLAIGVELVRDPVLLVLDDPTAGLDPLSSYLLVSMVRSDAVRRPRTVLLSAERPRSDIFPFLDRVAFLCLGEVVYAGSTRMLLDYFRSINFPCPELENPLMYYLCLSTVDRRTRERFAESSAQIAALVDKFKVDGAPFRRAPPLRPPAAPSSHDPQPPSQFQIFAALTSQRFCVRGDLLLRLLLLPAAFALLAAAWAPHASNSQQGMEWRGTLLLACVVAASGVPAAFEPLTRGGHRRRLTLEAYGGAIFILADAAFTLPLAGLSVIAAASIVYLGCGLRWEWSRWACASGVLWALAAFADQQTSAVAVFVRSDFAAVVASLQLLLAGIVFASGTVRAIFELPEWLQYLSYGSIFRYAAAFLFENEFAANERLSRVPFRNGSECRPQLPAGCVYVDGNHFLRLRFANLDYWTNFVACFAFVLAMVLLNAVLYSVCRRPDSSKCLKAGRC